VSQSADTPLSPQEAERIIQGLASVFFEANSQPFKNGGGLILEDHRPLPDIQARYHTLVEQVPAVVFMIFLDRGISEAYVSPYIEAALGFSQDEWLDDPIRWYRQIHPDDKERWNLEAAQMVLSGEPLRSVYRIIARDGHTVWFHCDVKMVRTEAGRPWFVHGIASISPISSTPRRNSKRPTMNWKIELSSGPESLPKPTLFCRRKSLSARGRKQRCVRARSNFAPPLKALPTG
jgi:PAS domain S-box-containing protein